MIAPEQRQGEAQRETGSMSETTLQAADGHRLGAYVAAPEGTPRAGLVVIQEIFGVNSHIRGVADDYAVQGYTAVAPALFDRREAGLELAYDEAGTARGRALRAELSWDAVAQDVAAAVEHAREASGGGLVGIVGYCWGGSVAWLGACRSEVAAAVGYYGGQVHELRGETPRCPVMLHFGERDSLIPLEQVKEIGIAHPDVAIQVYPAEHGFNCDRRGSYEAASASLARERSLAFFTRHLG